MGTREYVERCIAQKDLGPPNTMSHTAGQVQGRVVLSDYSPAYAAALSQPYFVTEQDIEAALEHLEEEQAKRRGDWGNAWNQRLIVIDESAVLFDARGDYRAMPHRAPSSWWHRVCRWLREE